MSDQYLEEETGGGDAASVGKTDQTGKTKPGPVLETHSALEVQTAYYPPLVFPVADLLPQGLNIIAGASKIGKSWLVLDLCLCVAAGKPFLNRETVQTGSLYLALEDGYRRIQDRMNKQLCGETAPANLDYATQSLSMAEGLFPQLEGYMTEHPQTGLIVIDALQCVRDKNRSSNENAYEIDYRDLRVFKALADRWNLCLLLVHHDRKTKDPLDPFNDISGSRGMSGVVDTCFMLQKERRFANEAQLLLTGRDVESRADLLRFDKSTCRWICLGDAEQLEEQRDRQSYESEPIVQTVRTLLEREPDGWCGSIGSLMRIGREVTGHEIASSPRGLAYRLAALDEKLLKFDRILHERRANGTGGGLHCLSRSFADVDPQPFTTVATEETVMRPADDFEEKVHIEGKQNEE